MRGKDGRWLFTAPCGIRAKWPSKRRTPVYKFIDSFQLKFWGSTRLSIKQLLIVQFESVFWGFLRIKLDDVISGRKSQWTSFGGIEDLELNNHMQQSDLHYLFFVSLRNNRTEAMISIFKLKKMTEMDSNWTTKSCFILSWVRRIRWTIR